MKKATKFLLIFYIIWFFVCILLSMYTKWKQTGNPFVPETILYFLITYTISVLMMVVMIFFEKNFSKKTQKQMVKQMLPAVIIFWTITYIVAKMIYLVNGKS